MRIRTKVFALLTALAALVSMCSCIPGKSIDDVIKLVDSTKLTIAGESAAWRDELDKLRDGLKALESQVAEDVRDIVTATGNQVGTMIADAIAVTDQAVESRIAQAGVEFRCNGNFVRQSAVEEVGFLLDDLKFWKQHHTRGAKPPAHKTCWVDPGAVSMYRNAGGRWEADTTNTEGARPIINVFGYNFRSDAKPEISVRAGDQAIEPSPFTVAYRTNYLVSIDLAAGLADMPSDMVIVLDWPDDPQHSDSTTISLSRTSDAVLELSDPEFEPAQPVANGQSVILRVKVTNSGGRKSGTFEVKWTPEPGVTLVSTHAPLAPRAADSVAFEGHVFSSGGDKSNDVRITGGASEHYLLTVAPPQHLPAAERRYGSGDADNTNDFPKQDSRQVAWGEFGGRTFDVNYGGPCSDGYVRSRMSLDVTKVTTWGGQDLAWATIRWANTNPQDCTVLVHYNVSTPGVGQRNNEIAVTISITEKGV